MSTREKTRSSGRCTTTDSLVSEPRREPERRRGRRSHGRSIGRSCTRSTGRVKVRSLFSGKQGGADHAAPVGGRGQQSQSGGTGDQSKQDHNGPCVGNQLGSDATTTRGMNRAPCEHHTMQRLSHVTWFDERLGQSPSWDQHTKNTFIDLVEHEDGDGLSLDRAALRRDKSAPARAATAEEISFSSHGSCAAEGGVTLSPQQARPKSITRRDRGRSWGNSRARNRLGLACSGSRCHKHIRRPLNSRSTEANSSVHERLSVGRTSVRAAERGDPVVAADLHPAHTEANRAAPVLDVCNDVTLQDEGLRILKKSVARGGKSGAPPKSVLVGNCFEALYVEAEDDDLDERNGGGDEAEIAAEKGLASCKQFEARGISTVAPKKRKAKRKPPKGTPAGKTLAAQGIQVAHQPNRRKACAELPSGSQQGQPAAAGEKVIHESPRSDAVQGTEIIEKLHEGTVAANSVKHVSLQARSAPEPTRHAAGKPTDESATSPARLTGQQADVLALIAVRGNEYLIACHMRDIGSQRLVVAAPSEVGPISGADILQVELGDVVACEATDAYGWGFGTVIAPARLSGQRGCFCCEGLQPVRVELNRQAVGDTLALGRATWKEVEVPRRATTAQLRLRDKALLKRMAAARAAWDTTCAASR